jgi:hypothetical protein
MNTGARAAQYRHSLGTVGLALLLPVALLLGAVFLPGKPAAAAATDPAGYSADALYNLANSYARAGKPALAVLNYERAGLLAPGDADVEANLRFVQAAAHLPAATPHGFERAVTAAAGPTVFFWLGVLGVTLIGAGALVAQLTEPKRWIPRAALIAGCALLGSSVTDAALLWPRLHRAVVLTPATAARATPVPMGDTLFVLPEAETVRMTAEHDEFVLVQTAAGRAGWVTRSSLAPVVPRTR